MAVGLPMKTTYANGDVYSASDVNDITGTVNLVGQTNNRYAGKNALINGNMDIWQRGTSFSPTSSPWIYTADRWAGVTSTGTATYAQETTVVPSGSRYSMKITAGATQIPYLAQEIETMNVLPFAGQTVTVSAQVAASTSIPMTMVVQYSTNVDEPVINGQTTITATSGGTAIPTSTTFVTISGVYAIPSTAKSIRVYISPTSNMTSGQIIYIGKFQFELGSAVTAFARAGGTIQGELAACQRYYWRAGGDATYQTYGGGNAYSTTAAQIVVPNPVNMRVGPTSIDYATLALTDGSTAPAVTVITIGQTGKNGLLLTVNVASGLTTNRYFALTSNNSLSGYLGFSAEL